MRFFAKLMSVAAIIGLSAGYGWSADDDTLLLPPPPPSVDGGLELPPPPPAPAVDNTAPVVEQSQTSELVTPSAPAADSDLALPIVADDTATVSEEVDVLPPAQSVAPTAPVAQDLGGVAGKITGGRVNIRAGQSTKYEIVLTADVDTPVTVYEKVGEWVKIAYPQSEFCYINQRYISGDIPADIPEQGLVREVRGSNVNIRARPWPGSTVVGQLNTGDSVFITGIRGQWVRIRPPASAKAWVFHKYISYGDGVKETASPVAKSGDSELDQYGNTVKAAADNIVAQNQNNPLLDKIRARAEAERKAREMRRNAVQNILSSVEDQMVRIDTEAERAKEDAFKRSQENKKYEAAYRAEVAKNYKPGPPPGSMGYDATGWVEYIGYLNNRTAGYRLVKGGETIYLLRSLYYDLDDFVGKHVRVSGTITDDVSSNDNIMEVKRLSLYNGTYISPNTQVLENQPVGYDVSANVSVGDDEETFAPMIEEDVQVNTTGSPQIGDSFDVTGLNIPE